MFAAGTHISERVELLEPFAEGAFGVLWRGRHRTLGCDVAVKLLTELDDEARSRFDAEAKLIARLKSPHIVQVFDSGVFEGTPYIVMELLEGESLGARIQRDGALPHADVQRIVTQVASALDLAHWQDVVHRDVKPDNIFLCEDEGELVAKLIDFGIARPAWARTAKRFTADRAMMGSPAYMSPEQIRCSKTVTGAADVWSLAVVAFEALTGHLPFGDDMRADVAATVGMILSRQWGPSEGHLRALPAPLNEVFEQAFALEPEGRFAKASGFAHALSDCIEAEEVLAPAGVPTRTRWLPVVALLGFAMLVASALTRWSTPQARTSAPRVPTPVQLRTAPSSGPSPSEAVPETPPAPPRHRPAKETALSPAATPPAPEASVELARPIRRDYGF